MSIYYARFKYNGYTNLDYNVIIASFSGDNGETESFLSMETMSTAKYDGTKQFDYGAKYNSVIETSLSLIKNNYSTFSTAEIRSILKWLTGSRKVSWLDLYNVNGAIEYSILGRFTDVKLYKLDARVIGLVCTYTAVSPWAYSDVQTIQETVENQCTIVIENMSDDLYGYTYPTMVFKNTSSAGELQIKNLSLSDVSIIKNIVANEVITLNSNQMIFSDNGFRIFGDDFNFVWPRFCAGTNNLEIVGNGQLTISYRYAIKIADAITDQINT